VIEVRVCDEHVVDFGLRVEVEPRRERARVDREVTVDEEARRTVAGAFASVAAEDL
jgi:hypothetical protein